MQMNVDLYSVFRKRLAVEENKEWIFWKSDGTFPQIPYHIRSCSAALFICRKGYLDLEINLKDYHFTIDEAIVLLPEHILRIKSISPDFTGYGLIISDKLWKEVRRGVEKMKPYYTSAREVPCIPITPYQSDLLLSYLKIFSKKFNSPQTTHNQIIVRTLITTLLYEIYQLYTGVINTMQVTGKKEKIFQEFLKLVAVHYKQERNIQFYAEHFQMTPRYFSNLIKETSQQSAAEWIDNYIVTEAGILLRTTNSSVKEVAEALNFPDQSFFGKYFKRHTGISPKEYKSDLS